MSSPLARALAAGTTVVFFASALSLAQLPPGHPGVANPGRKATPPPQTTTEPTEEARAAPPPARPEDVRSAEDVVRAYYESISGPKGQARDWDRFRSLFLPDADLMSVQQMHESVRIISLTPEEYMHLNANYFENGGYFESEIHRDARSFGIITQVFSTYESRYQAEGPAYSRGINAFQLLYAGNRWWITSVTWDRETPENAIPGAYLPAE